MTDLRRLLAEERGPRIRGVVGVIILAVTTILAAGFAWKSYDAAVEYEKSARLLAEQAAPDAKVKNRLKELFFLLDEEEVRAIEEQRGRASQLRDESHEAFYLFLALAMGGVAAAYAISRQRRQLSVGILLICSVALVAGLASPAMAVTASKSLDMVGEVVLYFESKGIWATITNLIGSGGNFYIGIPIFLFSVAFPTLKTGLLLFATLSPQEKRQRIVTFIHRMGKWSMADVFVVGWFVGYLANKHQELLRPEIQVGILFFTTYAILSGIAGAIVESEYRHMVTASGRR